MALKGRKPDKSFHSAIGDFVRLRNYCLELIHKEPALLCGILDAADELEQLAVIFGELAAYRRIADRKVAEKIIGEKTA